MNNKIIIDTESIRKFNNDIKNKSEEIINIFLEIEKDFADIELKFNSNAGKLYREKITNYISYVEKKVTDENESLTNKINAIIKVYEDTGKEIEKMVN